MKRLGLLLALSGLLLVNLAAGSALIGESLAPVLQTAQEDDFIHVLILLNPEPDGPAMMRDVQGVRASDRAAVVWERLHAIAEEAQVNLLDVLSGEERQGRARSIRSLVIGNAVEVTARPAVIRAAMQRRDVRAIDLLVEEKVVPEMNTAPLTGELDEIVWGVSQIHAPDVWNMGYTGQGVIVGVMDTGCNYNHQDLADHMWDGGPSYPNHGWDFAYNDNNPTDNYGHGSHVAGTVAGDGTAGSQTGVAPDARVMVLKVFNDSGSGTYANVWAALDFALAHGANVVTMSAGWHNMDTPSRGTFRTYYEMLNAAGIVSVNSAGNDGNNQGSYPIPDNVKTPASVPPPWLHPDQADIGTLAGQITIGSTDQNNTIAYYSSRGPCSWENVSPWFDWDYSGGAQPGVIKPDVCAPGEDIKSLLYSSNTGYTIMSGTSMATPHVAGLCALLKSISLDLTPARIDEIMETTALALGTPGKDNTYGSGRVDALAAATLAIQSLYDLMITLDPLYNPYYIPAGGGTIVFDAHIVNNYDVNTPGQVRTLVILPNSNEYPLDTYNLTYHPGVDIDVYNRSQTVPGMAPSGTYSYVARAGITPWTLVDEDSFQFIKFGLGEDASDTAWMPRAKWFTETAADNLTAVPSEFGLGAAYPNPFNPSTTISLALPRTSEVNVVVYDALGRQVARLINGVLPAGSHTLAFDAAGFASGVYFIQAQADGRTALRKVVLMK